jgi:predicted Zn-dependent protease
LKFEKPNLKFEKSSLTAMNEQDNKLLDDYLDGLLSAEQQAEVRQRAATEPALAQALAHRQELASWLQQEPARERTRAVTAQLGAEFFDAAAPSVAAPSTLRVGWKRPQWLAAAAALALLVVAAWWLLRGPAEPPTYAALAQHEPLQLTVRGAADPITRTAETAFNQKDYASALNALQGVLADDPQNLTAQLYQGICLLELQRPADARNVLEPLANGNSALRSDAQWYVALSFLQEKNAAACASTLRQIDPESSRGAAARELLKLLSI